MDDVAQAAAGPHVDRRCQHRRVESIATLPNRNAETRTAWFQYRNPKQQLTGKMFKTNNQKNSKKHQSNQLLQPEKNISNPTARVDCSFYPPSFRGCIIPVSQLRCGYIHCKLISFPDDPDDWTETSIGQIRTFEMFEVHLINIMIHMGTTYPIFI